MRRILHAILLGSASAGATAQSPTWTEDVACIVYSHCASCHHEGGPAHFSLMTYADAYYWRVDMRDATQVRYMPPWPPDEEYRSLAHERSLTQDEIDIIAAWVNNDAPEGPGSAPVPPVFTNEPVIDAPDISAVMEDYVIPASTADLYRCFVLHIDNPADRYITGLEVIPGNTSMVHHVLVFQDTSGQAQVLDDADIEPGYTNFGGVGVDNAKLVGIWAPGADPFFTPPGMGIKLLANADIVIQIHYPANSTSEVDSTRINIQLSPGGFIRDLAIDPVLDHLYAITDGPLIIAPNEVRTFHAQYTAPFPATITSIGPHSHLLGRRMKAYAVRPGNDTVPLIDIPDWDFRWQGMYSFRQPIYLPANTVVYGETTYDNTVNNPDNPNSPPDWVWLGEATTNEMMLFYFGWTFGFPSDEDIVVDNSPHAAHHQDCVVDFNIGMEEAGASASFEVWPVPAHDVITVNGDRVGAEVRLLDISGRVVLRERIADRTLQLDVRELARGTYVLELTAPGDRSPQRTKVLLESITVNTDEHFMRQALREAEQSFKVDEIPVGAVIVCQDLIIARSHNLTERLNDVTAHAEMQSITAAAEHLGGKYLKECTLFVTVEPCVMCAGALHWSQIGRIVFGAFDEKAGYRRMGARLLHPKTKVTGGVLEAECADLMKAFFKRKRAL